MSDPGEPPAGLEGLSFLHSSAYNRQVARERAQREAALGNRARAILRGDLGPVLRRWVSGSISPVAARVEGALQAILRGDQEGAASLLASPVFGLMDCQMGRRSPVLTVVKWAMEKDRLQDFVLGVLGTAITTCATQKDAQPVPLTRVLLKAGEVCRETAIGQFLTGVQGAKSMMKVRKSGKASWQQTKTLNDVAALMGGQVRAALGADSEELPIGGREVVSVTPKDGLGQRRIELRRPAAGDWELLSVARQVTGERDVHLATWSSFAMLILCAAQAEAGWFDLTSVPKRVTIRRRGQRRHKPAHGLVLSDSAYGAIKADLDKWMGLGFVHEPMLIEPEDGDYLTVKHRKVAGGRGPRGMRTEAGGTTAWQVASDTLGKTAWSVPELTLKAIRESEFVQDLVAKAEPDEVRREVLLGEYRKLAQEPAFYMPLYMDFRGRVYTRSGQVTYQGRDLQKALMCFPKVDPPGEISSRQIRAVVMHASNLYGNGLDKAPWGERYEWFMSNAVQFAVNDCHIQDWEEGALASLLARAEEPLQLLTTLGLWAGPGASKDRIACQIDGTCNGLQHLSALFRDETAAPYVNLTAAPFTVPPADLYGRVAERVRERLTLLSGPWARRVVAAIKVDRKLCKKPVMVLPYGGTRTTIEDAVMESMLAQEPNHNWWTHGMTMTGYVWEDWLEGNYQAFMGRELRDHPLFHSDAKRLGALVWESIEDLLPRPMAAMEAFRKIARTVGDQELAWSTGFGENPLWVIQAKSKAKAARMNLQGFQLPGSVRGLQIRQGSDEVDSLAHVTGLVANFIHSMDARHLVATLGMGYEDGVRSFGSIHDCLITRPSQMGDMKNAVRETFWRMYERDPLNNAVRVGQEEFASWYALAESVGVSFPEPGRWDPREVLESAWFFS